MEGSFVLLEHLIRISFQGLFSETYSDYELILKGSVTGIQPSIELVILLLVIRKKLVCFQLWSHLSQVFLLPFWLLLLLRSPLHLMGLKQVVANCLQLKAWVAKPGFFILWRVLSTEEDFQSLCSWGAGKSSPSLAWCGWQRADHVFECRCSRSSTASSSGVYQILWHTALSRCSLF